MCSSIYDILRFENDTLIAEAKRDYDLRQAANDQEVKTQKAISDLARDLQGTDSHINSSRIISRP